MRKLKNCSKHSIVEKVSTTDKFWTMKSSNLCLFTILWRKKKSAGNDLVILRMGNKNWLSSYAFVEQAVAAPQVAVKARRYPKVACHVMSIYGTILLYRLKIMRSLQEETLDFIATCGGTPLLVGRIINQSDHDAIERKHPSFVELSRNDMVINSSMPKYHKVS